MPRSPGRRLIYGLKWLVGFAAILLLFGVIAAVWLFRATQQVPEFYAKELAIAPEQAAEAGDRLERTVLELHNEVVQDERFHVTFTAEEINGWLASDLVEKFPKLLPPTVHDPRIALEPGTAIIAFRYEEGGAATVVTIQADAQLLEGEDVLSVRLLGLKAGSVPVPLGPLLENIRRETEKRKIPVRWEDDNGHPVVLIPLRLGDELVRDRQVVLDGIQIEPSGVTIVGEVLKPTQDDAVEEKDARQREDGAEAAAE